MSVGTKNRERTGVVRKRMNKAVSPKKQQKTRKRSEIEREYQRVFFAYPLPNQGIYTEDDSLEQPSALKYVPSTTTPSAEA